MKVKLYFAAALSAVSFLFAACDSKVGVTVPGGGETVAPDEIGMTVKETRAVSFAVETVAGEEIGGYYVGLADTEYLVSTFGDGAGNIDFDAVAQAMIDMENEYDADWTDPDLVYSGTKVFNSFLYGLLDKGTSYTVVAFGVSAAGEKTSDVFSVEVVTSASVSPSDNEIKQVVSNISDSGAVVEVTTSNYDIYYADLLEASSIEGKSDEEIFQGVVDSYGDYIEWALCSGDSTIDYTGWCEPGTEYCAVVIGYEDGKATTKVYKEFFTTTGESSGTTDPSDMTFTSTVDDVMASALAVTVTPSDDNAAYFWDVFTDAEYQAAGGTVESAPKLIADKLQYYADYYSDYYGFDFTVADIAYTLSSYGAESAGSTYLDWSTDYRLIAAAIDEEGNVISECYVSDKVTTLARAEISASIAPLDAELAISNVTSSGATFAVTPADNEATFYYSLIDKEYYQSFSSDVEYIYDDLDYMDYFAVDYGMSISAVYEGMVAAGYQTYDFTELEPSTAYVAYAYGMTADGTITAGMVKTEFSTTAAASSSVRKGVPSIWHSSLARAMHTAGREALKVRKLDLDRKAVRNAGSVDLKPMRKVAEHSTRALLK